MKTLIVNGSVYQGGGKTVKTIQNMAKESLKGQNAIYSIEKDGVIEMRKDIFPSVSALKKEVTKYIKDGFKVKYTMNGSMP